jgi:putative endonuclease
MNAFVYILKCADGSFYTGITRRSVDERLSEHNQGLVASYTRSRRPVFVVYSAEFERIDEAVATERQIKGWNRAKKQALIDGDFQRLQELAAIRTADRTLREPQGEVGGRDPSNPSP